MTTMERKMIELGGIVRNLPDNTVKDGMMKELINLSSQRENIAACRIKDKDRKHSKECDVKKYNITF